MSNTLILMFHPNPAKSRANAALATAARALDQALDVEVVDMQARYPKGRVELFTDGAAEAAQLIASDRIVLQFPVQWYSTPPLVKAWQDAVLTRMMYIHPAEEGARLAGKRLMVAATAGNVPEAYRPEGANGFTLHELFAPLRATARRCGLLWEEPFLIYRADKLGEDELAQAVAAYCERLVERAPQRLLAAE